MARFKRVKVSEETKRVIFYDLECLELKKTNDNKYHYTLLRNNLIDLLGYPKESIK